MTTHNFLCNDPFQLAIHAMLKTVARKKHFWGRKRLVMLCMSRNYRLVTNIENIVGRSDHKVTIIRLSRK